MNKRHLREIEEETSVIGRILRPLDTVEYSTGNGNRKRVVYFAVRAVDRPSFEPNPEVDRIEWVKKKKALRMLTYDFDKRLLEANSIKRLAALGQVHLVRHAAAGDRSSWSDADHLRPISGRGLGRRRRSPNDWRSGFRTRSSRVPTPDAFKR